MRSENLKDFLCRMDKQNTPGGRVLTYKEFRAVLTLATLAPGLYDGATCTGRKYPDSPNCNECPTCLSKAMYIKIVLDD